MSKLPFASKSPKGKPSNANTTINRPSSLKRDLMKMVGMRTGRKK